MRLHTTKTQQQKYEFSGFSILFADNKLSFLYTFLISNIQNLFSLHPVNMSLLPLITFYSLASVQSLQNHYIMFFEMELIVMHFLKPYCLWWSFCFTFIKKLVLWLFSMLKNQYRQTIWNELDSRCNNAIHAIKYIYVIKQNCK